MTFKSPEMLGMESTMGTYNSLAQELCKSQLRALKPAGIRDSQRSTRGILRIAGAATQPRERALYQKPELLQSVLH